MLTTYLWMRVDYTFMQFLSYLFESMTDLFGEVRVPRSNPFGNGNIPPEVVFFGDPRRPPPLEAANDPQNQVNSSYTFTLCMMLITFSYLLL